MALQFHQVLTPGIAQLSYLIGDTTTGEAVVIDPRPDCDVYLEMAREHQLSITHILETHIHADFLSGARELAARACTAKIYCSSEGEAEYGFDRERVRDGDTFELGCAMISAKFTPGHTPEHMSFLLAEKKHAESPWGVVSGDSLFVDSVGRPDLLGDDQAERLMKQLYNTVYAFYLDLEDDVILYPGHGQGSACGAEIGDRLTSTIGYERKFNKYLQCSSLKEFKDLVEANAPPVPTHYPRLKKVNAKGPDVIGHLPYVPALPPAEFMKRMKKGDAVVVDTRSMLAFGGGHVDGALNLGADKAELSVYAGWMLDPDQPIMLILESEENLENAARYFWRTGFTKFAGYLSGGMAQWNAKAMPIQKVPQLSVHDIKGDGRDLQLLDVRAPEEWEKGHIPGAVHHFVGDMRDTMPELDRDRPVATYCATGYRASLAASILLANGFQKVRNIPGSWTAWQNAGYPVEDGQ